MGLGHLTRCIALAEAFAASGHTCQFVGSVPDFLAQTIPGEMPLSCAGPEHDWTNDEFIALAGNASLLVTDHYEIGADWQSHSPAPVLAITDPPLRPQHCELLLLPTVFDAEIKGAMTAPAHCLLRSAVKAARREPKQGKRLLVSCGGGQDNGLTVRILDALISDDKLKEIQATIVVPDAAAGSIEVGERVAALSNAQLVSNVTDMAGLIAAHDIAIGAPGGSALERACLGLAQILVPIAKNQEALGTAFAARNCAIVLPANAGLQGIAAALRMLVSDDALRKSMASNGFALVDGRGAERVVAKVEKRMFHN